MNAPSLLEVSSLTARFRTHHGDVTAVDGTSFQIQAGRRLAIVGESGSGKTVTALTIVGIVGPPDADVSGSIRYRGRELVGLSEREYQHIRGRDIGLVLQDPLSSLNPVMTIGEQLVEVIRVHRQLGKVAARELAVTKLAEVGIPEAWERLHAYPHEFSGGMRQRVGIALALSGDPDLLIADEPTTALDVTIQAQILRLLRHLSDSRNMAVVLITHDLAVVAGFAHDVLVMYGGRVMEYAPCPALFAQSRHPYTQALLASLSRVDRPRRDRLPTIPGRPPQLHDRPVGCPFHPRCAVYRERAGTSDRCVNVAPEPESVGNGSGHISACHYSTELG